MFAVTSSAYRALVEGEPLLPGEQAVATVPDGVLQAIATIEVEAEVGRLRRRSALSELSGIGTQEGWDRYRRELDELKDKPGYPSEVQWPVVPS